MMFPRLINFMYVRKNCFCVSAILLWILITFLSLYLFSFHFYYNSRYVKSLYKKQSEAIDQFLRFGPLSIDGSGNYFVYHDVNLKTKVAKSSRLTVITHCSLSNIPNLLILLDNWSGPISLALFVDSPDDVSVVLKAVAHCNFSFIQRVQLHIVRPSRDISSPTSYLSNFIQLSDFFKDPVNFCDKFHSLLLDCSEKRRNYNSVIAYPNNLLRNVAHGAAKTDFILHLDIDMIPSKNLNTIFPFFINNSKEYLHKTAFVLPAFEVGFKFFLSNKKQFPINKSYLATLYEKNLVRPFYSEVCYHCQNRTDYKKWFSYESKSDLAVAYNVAWGHAYEPLFISLRNQTLSFDERFKQYGYNRLSLLCEMHVSGWKFSVLDSAFVLHIGFKESASMFYDKKQIDTSRNWKLYHNFRQSLTSKYPNSTKNCDIPPVYIM